MHLKKIGYRHIVWENYSLKMVLFLHKAYFKESMFMNILFAIILQKTAT